MFRIWLKNVGRFWMEDLGLMMESPSLSLQEYLERQHVRLWKQLWVLNYRSCHYNGALEELGSHVQANPTRG